MTFDLATCLEVLERTPSVLETMLGGLSSEWTGHNEGGDRTDKTFVSFSRQGPRAGFARE